MGVVYRATDLDLDVCVALKTLRSEISSDPAMLERFKREVLLARSIAHDAKLVEGSVLRRKIEALRGRVEAP